MDRLAGKAAFVAGAGGGIGAAVCRLFTDEGAQVVAADVSLERAVAAVAACAHPERAVAVQCDVSDNSSVVAAIAAGVATYGSLNIVVNLAGGSTPLDLR